MEKKKESLQEIDWRLHTERMMRGFVNRWHERRSLHPKHKRNCRKHTLGRIKYYREFGQNN